MCPCLWIYPDLIDNNVEQNIPSFDQSFAPRPAVEMTTEIVYTNQTKKKEKKKLY